MPRVAHPDWLQARLVQQHDPMKQRSIKEVYIVIAPVVTMALNSYCHPCGCVLSCESNLLVLLFIVVCMY